MNKPSFIKNNFDFNRLFFLFIRCTLSLIMGAVTYLQIVRLYVYEAYSTELVMIVIGISLLFGVLFILADYKLWFLSFPAAILLGGIALYIRPLVWTIKDIYKNLIYYAETYTGRPAESPLLSCSLPGFSVLFLVICFYVVMVSYLGCAPILGTMPFWFLIVAGCLTGQFPELWVIILISIVTTLNIILNAHRGKGLNLSALSSGSLIALICTILCCVVFLPPFFSHAQKYQNVLRDFQANLTANLKNGDINDALASLTEDPSTLKLKNEPISNSEEVQLEVSASENKPYGKIYLKGFAGSKYIGNGWKAASSSDFERYSNQIDVAEDALLSVNYKLIQSVYELTPELNALETVFDITHKGDEKSYRYTPENPRVTEEDADHSFADGYLLRSGETEYSFTAYQIDDIRNVGKKIGTNPLDDWVEENYTDVGELADNQEFISMMSGADGLDFQGKIDYVKNTLAQFTYSNDFEPINESNDFVENFLFHQKLGTCQHFASTGTLMLRYLGIPARFVSGYAYDIDNSANSLINGVEDTWTFSVREYHSHAWVEVYDSDYGWITLDVTPSSAAEEYFEAHTSDSDDSAEAQATPTPEPEEDYEPTPEPEETDPEPTPEPEDLDIDDPEEEEEIQPEEDEEIEPESSKDNSALLALLIKLLIILIILAVLCGIYLLIKRRKDKTRFIVDDKHELSEILGKNLSLIEDCLGHRNNETDREYLNRVLKSILDNNQLEQYITACEVSAFSGSEYTEEAAVEITEICRICRTSSLAKLKKGKRFVYTYLMFR